MTDYKELLLGCGSNLEKYIYTQDSPEWKDLTTLDFNADHKPDVIFDLNHIRLKGLPFEDNAFDEIHAYEVLEHLGSQGDWQFFFAEWNEYYRILRPRGLFVFSCPKPSSPWAWGDPSHTRIISPETIIFLSQKQYEANADHRTAMSDFRFIYKGDFQPLFVDTEGQGDSWYCVLQSQKESQDG